MKKLFILALGTFGTLSVLAGCGSEVAHGRAQGAGILHDASVERFKYAIFDSYQHNPLRKSHYVVLSSEADICAKLQKGEMPEEPVIVLSKNTDKKDFNSGDSDALVKRDRMLSGKPNWQGGVLHLVVAPDKSLQIYATTGDFHSREVTQESLAGDATLYNIDVSTIAFNAARCSNSVAKIRQLLADAKYDLNFDPNHPRQDWKPGMRI